ncbi:hypothetical protein NE857_28670 [Nocardiopsis exhalans]|uniref:Uncharacterized protein n=1 Tax=Nocardiopsis exhalans TaxID=163604 RepID=A0ABY5D7I5_9ACTN|nr:hypothetical protein [Nocardiopsis exhalans]USY19193.1 hypothetical protein NE857_28670 [Nocardiopsis exhalans]
MATSDHSGNRQRASVGGEDPTAAVPEADAAEQHAPASAEGSDDWTETASAETFEQANEADVIEQAQEAGLDEEERR